ncbi:MAG: HAMP domain-containing sensor histidine kinase [Prosthecobacter sp.]|nr:HAMP domain-containing sensor histidine kinase [Prosthecobacter sp.]
MTESTRPAGSTPTLRTFLLHYFLWGFGARVVLWAAFQWRGPVFLAEVFGVSAIAFLVALPLLVAKRWNILIVILGLEWAHLSTRLTVGFGWTSGFHLQLLLLTVVTLIFDHIPIRIRVLMALLPIIAFVVRFPLLMMRVPVVPLSAGQDRIIYMLNALFFIGTTMLLVLHFVQSALRQRARAEALAESRATLIANMSHELKTPLAAMLTTVQSTLKRERTPAEFRDAMRVCERNTRDMSRLVIRMLDIVAADANQIIPQMQDVQLAVLLGESLASMHATAASRNISVKLEVDPNIFVQADRDLLSMIVTNLLSNAIRHCDEGRRVTIMAGKAENEVYFVSVEDEGRGIAPGDLPHIFDPFYRADKSRSGSDGSMGLGLSIAARFAGLMGGEIRVESGPGKGAKFTLLCRGCS